MLRLLISVGYVQKCKKWRVRKEEEAKNDQNEEKKLVSFYTILGFGCQHKPFGV